jgi:hypothetical protein
MEFYTTFASEGVDSDSISTHGGRSQSHAADMGTDESTSGTGLTQGTIGFLAGDDEIARDFKRAMEPEDSEMETGCGCGTTCGCSDCSCLSGKTSGRAEVDEAMSMLIKELPGIMNSLNMLATGMTTLMEMMPELSDLDEFSAGEASDADQSDSTLLASYGSGEAEDSSLFSKSTPTSRSATSAKGLEDNDELAEDVDDSSGDPVSPRSTAGRSLTDPASSDDELFEEDEFFEEDDESTDSLSNLIQSMEALDDMIEAFRSIYARPEFSDDSEDTVILG